MLGTWPDELHGYNRGIEVEHASCKLHRVVNVRMGTSSDENSDRHISPASPDSKEWYNAT
jgi:hypothetical protein